MKLLLLALFIPLSLSAPNPATFTITIHSDHLRILSPDRFQNQHHLLLENRTHTRVMGKIADDQDQVLSYFSLRPEAHSRIDLQIRPEQRLRVIPLSPGLEAAELFIGRKAYEIPPKN